MDFSLKEAIGLLLGLMICGIVFAALLNFHAFDSIGNIIGGVL